MSLAREEAPLISKETLRAKVYAYLREMIIAGELLPGEAITLRSLSEKLGVSVAPVREALVQLESEKVILRRENRDYRVNTLTKPQFEEIFKIRRLVEPYLGKQACRNRSSEAVEKAEKIFEAMRNARKDAKRYVSLNHDLHFFFYSSSDCPILREIVSGLWARIGPYLTINLQNQDVDQTVDIHASMLASFARQDSEGFIKALLADMRFSHSYLSPFISG